MIYDDNSVTVDGSIATCFTDDTSAKVKAMGFNVLEVYDGTNDLTAIIKAMDEAKATRGKPSFIHIRTIIGFGSRKQNTGAAHGAALGEDEVSYVKQLFGFDPAKRFVIPDEVYGASLLPLSLPRYSLLSSLARLLPPRHPARRRR